MQVIEQLSQRRLLRIGIGVAGCLAVTGKPPTYSMRTEKIYFDDKVSTTSIRK